MKNYDIGKMELYSKYGKRFPEQTQLDGIYMPIRRDLFEKIKQHDFEQVRLLIEIKSDPNCLSQVREKITSLLVK